ncbi:MAG: DUF3048 domain-containing protein [Lachnospiraceae bacterium]|nr:DUF3048 domain-containing protein [Lachnospiraceae bacterium]
MRKWNALLAMALAGTMLLTACGGGDSKKETEAAATQEEEEMIVIGGAGAGGEQSSSSTEALPTIEETEEEVVDEAPEGMYASELTGEWIDESLQDQRPVAVMVDNDKVALPHYGVSDVDIVYELINSTQNEGVTRWMVMVKDWANIKRLGSIRSTRPTNLVIYPEWNAVLCHDGGPYYNDVYFKNPFTDHFSGTFSRIDNGKAREFTEYVVSGDLEKNFKNNPKVSQTYNEYYSGQPHYQFASRTKPNDLSSYPDAKTCTKLTLPFHHNNPWMEYDESTKTYKYFQYGSAEKDAANGVQLSFTNVLLQNAVLQQLDDHGYMTYHPTASGRKGLYITNGKAIEVTWTKSNDLDATRYYDSDGNEIKINVGKTYVGLIREEEWNNVEME